jgi:carbamoyltransferase
MYILGVNISHEPSACLLKDGEVVYFSEEERLTGIKNPEGSVDEIFAEYDDSGKILEICHQVDAIKKYTTWIDYIIFSSYGRDRQDDDDVVRNSFLRGLQNGGVNFNTSMFYSDNHHIYHAANAFFASGFDDAAALVLDGGGAFDTKYREEVTSEKYEYPFREIESIFNCSYDFPFFETKFKHCSILDALGDEMSGEEEIFWKRSKNEIYSRTRSCGDLFNMICGLFEMHGGTEAGKVMGLSGHRLSSDNLEENKHVFRNYEKEKPIFIKDWFMENEGVDITVYDLFKHFEEFIAGIDPDEYDAAMGSRGINTEFNNPTLDFYICASLADKLQTVTFIHTCNLIKKALDITGKNKIVLSGGYFLNCVNNYKYTKAFPNVEFFVDPIAHDAGTAIGAAKYLWYGMTKSKDKFPFKHLYFGPSA